MDRISAHDLATGIIDDCLDYGKWPTRSLDALIERALDEDDAFSAAAATRALFSVVVERLADLFEPQLCDVYARLFSRVIARVLPDFDADDLLLRYNRIRRVQPFLGGEIERVFILSRVTLGADVAVTSCVLTAAKERFPKANYLRQIRAFKLFLQTMDARPRFVIACLLRLNYVASLTALPPSSLTPIRALRNLALFRSAMMPATIFLRVEPSAVSRIFRFRNLPRFGYKRFLISSMPARTSRQCRRNKPTIAV